MTAVQSDSLTGDQRAFVLEELDYLVRLHQNMKRHAMVALAPKVNCAKCGRRIVDDGDDDWWHINDEGRRDRHCRAASFDNDADEAWDESVPRTLEGHSPEELPGGKRTMSAQAWTAWPDETSLGCSTDIRR
jgi:hypothetical protein